jgi:hypothetical protein
MNTTIVSTAGANARSATPAVRAALLTLGALSAAAIGVLVAPAGLASAESAATTIGLLEAQGFDVKINRVGSAPLDQCVVTDVRNPRDRTELVRVNRPGDDDDLVPVVVRRTITVTLDCSR